MTTYRERLRKGVHTDPNAPPQPKQQEQAPKKTTTQKASSPRR